MPNVFLNSGAMNILLSLYSIIKLLLETNFLSGLLSSSASSYQTESTHSAWASKDISNNFANNCQIIIEVKKTVIVDDIR